MTSRIFRSIFLVALCVILACFFIITGLLYGYFNDIQRDQLKAQTGLAAQGVSNEGLAYLEDLRTDGYRITWVDSDGTVLYDNEADPAQMENHADREEIISAFETGYGESTRQSATLTERQLYSAQLLPDGTVIRISSTQYTVWNFFLLMLRPMAIVLIIAVALSLLLASRLSRNIVRPLIALDLDEPLSNDTYEELSPLLTQIEHQHREIDKQRAELERRRDEFTAVTDSMNEGLVLLNEKDVVLSINKSAARLLNTDSSCVGSNIMTVYRSLALYELLEKAQKGESAEKILQLAGGKYQLNASPVVSDGAVAGAALLLFDVTEKLDAEQMRREFTANVSHELKTPLHSISGCAEMIKNGMVKEEDVPQFATQIYTEARNLIALVEDIIRLSRIDEGAADLPKEPVDLLAIAMETETQLGVTAAKKAVTISVTGTHARITGILPILRELVFNLCDNAVKYNKPGGRVEISVSEEPDNVVLKVKDSGIGIPKEHQGRVFERFYRVDKSHSRESGGTGLGLSIVKHAARLHNAAIELQSEPDKGTAITVSFPK
ncbi:MAG: PAS domain-containing sensor histidine kinase [Clostridia bacterium]|nr:PAS domain-containing sensor histidine kinase [Clostridia bacterium]